MFNRRLLAASSLAAALAATPFAATAAVAPTPNDRTYTFYDAQVRQTDSVGFRNDFDGGLQLRIDSHGIVNGYFRRNGDGPFTPVVGGMTGSRIWLDIGGGVMGGLHIDGTDRNGIIEGSGFARGADFVFHATPRPSPAP